MKEKMIEKYKKSLLSSRGTLAIIFINIVVFITLNTIPDLADEILLYPQLGMIMRRPWTLVTVFFSHQIHVHLLANMGLVFVFGIQLEKITSSKTIFLIYLIIGFIGSLATIPVASLLEWTESVVGASAAAWGVVSAFAAMRPNTSILGGKAKFWVVALFVSNAIITILNPQISVGAGAHAIGITVGLICGYWIKNRELKKFKYE